jgi:hypothetical protein
MADFWTYAQLRTKVQNDTDTQSETFVSATELLGYFNEAIDCLEKDIHRLNEDYFLTPATLTLVQGTEDYPLPSDIYAMKIRAVIYRNGAQVFPIKRLRDWRKLENYELSSSAANNYREYSYFVKNSVAGQPRIIIIPVTNENGPYVKIWYIRNAARLVNDTDVCDIPEAANFIMQFVKNKIWFKEGNPMLAAGISELAAEKENLLLTLAEKTPDNETGIEPDLQIYYEMN